jgi:hypothetical protein
MSDVFLYRLFFQEEMVYEKEHIGLLPSIRFVIFVNSDRLIRNKGADKKQRGNKK